MHCTCPPGSVLIVTPWLEGGGAQKALAALMSRHKNTHFHVVALFSGSTNYGELQELSDVFTLLDNPRSPFGSLKASRSIGVALRRHKKVYSLLRGSHVVLGLRLQPRRKGQKVVGSIHQMPSSEGQGLVPAVENMMLRRFTRRADFITSPSRRAVEEAKLHGYADGSRIFYEPNVLVPHTASLKSPRQSELQTIRLLFAGRLTRQKGLDLVPELLKQVKRPITLRIIGDGPEKHSLEEELRLVPDIIKVEFVSYTPDIVDHIDWCDAVFMPSRAELNPVFLHEAWNRGRPALVSDIKAFRDLASEGTLAIASSSAQYAQAIELIARQIGLRSEAFEAASNPVVTLGILDDFLSS